MFRIRPVFLLSLCVGSGSLAFAVDFDSQIRPILSDKCYPCHGPDESTRQGGLRLDTPEGAVGEPGDFAAFVRGDINASEAIRRIESDDADETMPPPESKLVLTDSEKQVLRQWVLDGASWSQHWSFVPPERPSVPADPSGWSNGAIDRFVAARARVAGLTPNPPADRETLIRRVTLDLTGLPPTPDEIDAFLADRSEDAYEKLVDRLLASPHYGQRMAWDWLDASRYADTDGFQGDPTRTMWPWRDWLVDALNRNMPFDQFTIEMLAGDLLDQPTPEQVLATGFNRNHMFNGEGGRIAEETRVENVFDRAETTGTVWLGLTMTCCRCHDHKYDPISQKEYYQFYAFFDQTSENGRSGRGKTAPVLQYLPAEQRAERNQITKQLSEVKSEMARPIVELDRRQAAWERDTREQLLNNPSSVTMGQWQQLGPIERDGRAAFDQDLGPEKKLDLDAAIEGQRWKPADDLTEGTVYPLPTTVGATYFYRNLTCQSPQSIGVSLGSDDAIKVFLNGREILANFAARAAAADQEQLQLDLKPGDNALLIKVVNTGGIGGFYFRKTSESLLGLPADVAAALTKEPDQRNDKQTRLLREHFRGSHWDQWKALVKRRSQLEKRLAVIEKQAVTVMVMDQLPADKRRTTVVLQRGGYDKPTETEVSADVPSVFASLPQDGPHDRLDLARWLVHPDHPLTARVTVNRYWQTFFGRGLVASTEDFGSQGERPTHPDLLDYLATEFVESGWNVKQLHKRMVMSATYRQEATASDADLQTDPENIWLARSPRYRLPSWMLRDQALAVSGLLVDRFGGPSVKPYQPDGIWAEATFGKIKYQPDSGQKLYRRSLYVFWRRIVGPTMFFDGAKRQTCEVKPTRTNTPMHALTTLNEPLFVEAARKMAARITAAHDQTEARLRYGFRLATARQPDEEELDVLMRRVEQLTQDFSAHPDEASALLAVGQSPVQATVDASEQAAYTVICSILLNLDETLSKP